MFKIKIWNEIFAGWAAGIRFLTKEELARGEEAGHSYVDRLADTEQKLMSKSLYVGADSPFYIHSKLMKPSPEALELGIKGQRMLEATKAIKKEYVFPIHYDSTQLFN